MSIFTAASCEVNCQNMFVSTKIITQVCEHEEHQHGKSFGKQVCVFKQWPCSSFYDVIYGSVLHFFEAHALQLLLDILLGHNVGRKHTPVMSDQRD